MKKHWDGKHGSHLHFSAEAPTIIAGPCMLESLELGLRVGSFLKETCDKNGLRYVFKSSYDKANRTSKNSIRGPGLEVGLKNLAQIKNTLKVPVLTDVHTVEEVDACAPVCDILQIPAFLCEQRSLLLAAARTQKIIQVKKGQHTSAEQMISIARFLIDAGNSKVLLCERGSSFGYHDLVVDYRNLIHWRAAGHYAVFDATHAAQLPGAGKGQSSGIRSAVPGLARAAMACGIDALFMEVHENPDNALSDASTQLDFGMAQQVLAQIAALRQLLALEKRP